MEAGSWAAIAYAFWQLIDEIQHAIPIWNNTEWSCRFCQWAHRLDVEPVDMNDPFNVDIGLHFIDDDDGGEWVANTKYGQGRADDLESALRQAARLIGHQVAYWEEDQIAATGKNLPGE